ncbi:MAG: hypothetical protein EZS28_048872, partial [Streblomastix strix]
VYYARHAVNLSHQFPATQVRDKIFFQMAEMFNSYSNVASGYSQTKGSKGSKQQIGISSMYGTVSVSGRSSATSSCIEMSYTQSSYARTEDKNSSSLKIGSGSYSNFETSYQRQMRSISQPKAEQRAVAQPRVEASKLETSSTVQRTTTPSTDSFVAGARVQRFNADSFMSGAQMHRRTQSNYELSNQQKTRAFSQPKAESKRTVQTSFEQSSSAADN